MVSRAPAAPTATSSKAPSGGPSNRAEIPRAAHIVRARTRKLSPGVMVPLLSMRMTPLPPGNSTTTAMIRDVATLLAVPPEQVLVTDDPVRAYAACPGN